MLSSLILSWSPVFFFIYTGKGFSTANMLYLFKEIVMPVDRNKIDFSNLSIRLELWLKYMYKIKMTDEIIYNSSYIGMY